MNENSRKSELHILRMRLGSEELIVVSIPSLEPTLPDDLTRAERGVASLLLAGMSNRDIARARGVSVRTVANQAAAIFRKIGIRRRAQLGGGLLHVGAALPRVDTRERTIQPRINSTELAVHAMISPPPSSRSVLSAMAL